MESAITSRLTNEARMPSEPMVMPSEIAMVLNSIGVPPASRTPSFIGGSDFAQVIVARPDFRPGVGDSDDGFLEIFVGKTNGFEHRAGAGPVRPFGDMPAALPTLSSLILVQSSNQ